MHSENLPTIAKNYIFHCPQCDNRWQGEAIVMMDVGADKRSLEHAKTSDLWMKKCPCCNAEVFAATPLILAVPDCPTRYVFLPASDKPGSALDEYRTLIDSLKKDLRHEWRTSWEESAPTILPRQFLDKALDSGVEAAVNAAHFDSCVRAFLGEGAGQVDVRRLSQEIIGHKLFQSTPDELQCFVLASSGSQHLFDYQSDGNTRHLDIACELLTKAWSLTSINTPYGDLCARELATALLERARVGTHLSDLDEAISLLYSVMDSNQSQDEDSLLVFLFMLASALGLRFRLHSKPEDLDEGIERVVQSLRLCSRQSAHYPLVVSEYALLLQDRYHVRGSLDDLEMALELHEECLRILPDGSPHRLLCVARLCYALYDRYIRSGSAQDLEHANLGLQTAIDATRNANYTRGYIAEAYSAHCLVLRELYELTKNAELLDSAIAAGTSAITFSPANPMLHNNLGRAISSRYVLTHEIGDLDRMILAFKTAAESAQATDVNLPMYLNNVGIAYQDRFERTGDQKDKLASRKCFHEACLKGMVTSVENALWAAQNWADRASGESAWDEVVKAGHWHEALLNRLWRSEQKLENRELWLREGQSVPTQMGYALAQLQRNGEAVVVLDRGRARLLSTELGKRRDDMARLERECPSLARRYHDLESRRSDSTARQELFGDTGRLEEILESHERELAALVREIRCIDGFEAFLGTCDPADIISAAREVPLAHLAISSKGSVWLVSSGDGNVTPVWLHGVTTGTLADFLLGPYRDGLSIDYLGAYANAWHPQNGTLGAEAVENWKATIDRATSWLWDCLMAPLLTHIRDSEQDHLTIVPNGWVELLPLHAAWRCDPSSPKRLSARLLTHQDRLDDIRC